MRSQYLSDAEILEFFDECNHDADNTISYGELERMLDEVHQEIAPEPRAHNLHHKDQDSDARHAFLRSLMQNKDHLDKEEFFAVVRSWQIPTQEGEAAKKAKNIKLPWQRALRAKWSVDGPPYIFLAFVVALMLIFGVWQLVTYLKSETRAALGWGVVVAKASAGVLYPTLFFLILSMSRHLATLARMNYIISRFINLDRTQSFHIKISIFAMLIATLHAIGHLTGSFLYSSRPGREETVEAIVGQSRTYVQYVRTLAGWSGITCLGLFYSIGLGSLPYIRKANYEIFQLVHLLMFPFIGLLMAHGTLAILQAPMLGYWLAFPTLLVLLERGHRLYRGFIKVPAKFQVLDSDTVCITCSHPVGKAWRYEAGQYVLLQVPQISFFQWHPFTISTCKDDVLTLHLKTEGNWVKQIKESHGELTHVGIDGPFGAPAQRFYDFEKTIVIGLGIGVTPLSGILNDLEHNLRRRPSESSPDKNRSRSSTPRHSTSRSRSHSRIREQKEKDGPVYRCDLHWMVRDKNYYMWFSDLLNRVQQNPLHENLEVNIVTHLTAKRKKISTLIFRYLLDNYRTEDSPLSSLTGLVNKTHFGRADFPLILEEHYEEMKKLGYTGKVGVFYCGAPVVGYIIADQCQRLTALAREEGNYMRYQFMMEVFG